MHKLSAFYFFKSDSFCLSSIIFYLYMPFIQQWCKLWFFFIQIIMFESLNVSEVTISIYMYIHVTNVLKLCKTKVCKIRGAQSAISFFQLEQNYY